ncbi:unnamed protein product [Lactuca saligna]|uniref:Uncharacterized protein n=1 Tax=Lactuca saligna TaxID=75948 RepID=A0AA35V8Z4_LACSI|nr:unnamed protein product [Lactuca saligna]
MTSRRWSCPGFATFFLDKCDSIRTKSTGDICIGGLITLIGLGVGLQFPESEYVPVDDPPLYLFDCFTLARMELLVPINTQELHDDDAAEDNDDMQVENANVDSPFEPEDHYDLPTRQLPPPPVYCQPSGAHFEPQHQYQSYPQHHEPDLEPEFPLDIYSQLAALRLQGNWNTTFIWRFEEQ